MKDIMLKIVGKQFVGEEAEDHMEFVTEGKLYERNGATYLVYEESEFSGFPGCTTTLRLREDSVRMKRIGEEAGYGMEMSFKKGERYSSEYETPYGTMGMEIVTNRVENHLNEDGVGNVEVDYDVSLEGMAEGRNQLRIEVSQEC